MTPARRATLILFGTTILWGSSFFTMDWGVRGISARLGPAAAPSAFLFLRFALALAVFAVLFPRVVTRLDRGTLAGGALLSIPFYAGFILQVSGLAETTSTVSAFITSLIVVVTPLLGRLFFGERPGAGVLLGGAVSLAGVYVLTDPRGGLGRGEWLTLACAVAFAVQIQLTNVVTRRHSPEGVTFVQFAFATVASGATLLILGVGPGDLAASLGERHVAWTAAYTAVFCSVVAMGTLNRFQREITATRAAVLYTLEPVFAAGFAWLFQDEPMTPRKLAGGAIILAGNLACELLGRRSS